MVFSCESSYEVVSRQAGVGPLSSMKLEVNVNVVWPRDHSFEYRSQMFKFDANVGH